MHDGVQTSAVRIHPAKSEGKNEMEFCCSVGDYRLSLRTTHTDGLGGPIFVLGNRQRIAAANPNSLAPS
jgi:hypothetical protein